MLSASGFDKQARLWRNAGGFLSHSQQEITMLNHRLLSVRC
jgi:hypothetical protein